MKHIKKFLLALQFLTKITVKSNLNASAEDIGASGVWFPVVGLLIGLLLVGVNMLLTPLLPEIIVSILLVTLLAFLTGALHLDGFIDTVDGFYAGRNPEHTLKIMRDTQVGSMGVVTVFCLLLLKVFSINAFDYKNRNIALLIMPVLSRWCMLYSAAKYKYAREEIGLGRIFSEQTSMRNFMYAGIVPIFLTVLLIDIKGVWLILLAFFTAMAMAYGINKKINGITGDTLGAVNEIMEVLVLLFLLSLIAR